MAQPGFPWHSQSRDPEKDPVLPEGVKVVAPVVDGTKKTDLEKSDKCTSSTDHSQQRSQSTGQGQHLNGSTKDSPSLVSPVVKSVSDSSTSKPKKTPLPVRTIPPWVQDAEEEDLEDPQFQFPDAPHAALVAHHNFAPSIARKPLLSGEHHHDGGFVTSSGHVRPERTSRWISFARASAYPRETSNGEKVDPEYLNKHFTDYSRPWLDGRDEEEADENNSRYRAFRKKRQVWYKRAQFTILRNPFIPLAFRLTVFCFALIALALGTTIYHETGKIVKCIKQHPRSDSCVSLVGTEEQDYYRDPSGLMAVIVDAIALAYTLYITYDEYFSKPLGLRPARAKVRLVLLDLFFVVFQSANLALSFESLTVDEGACKVGDEPRTSNRFDNVCDRARALSGVLLVSLVAWLMTFSVSVLRLVERIDTK
ncbi:hypothetical protein HRR83_005273 [Exophiala dermatitidis]|uniref:Regulator of phospholipase D SRF1 n=3 Tax=Exophiala dermatitidis TaxID=5970 RepID=H6C1Y9_EXODN|nr:uncharacterized protein HMPREF1120_05838 [Exophiala dermatitidis NIH/UT8656]KAJ4512930.1 hypothetical protein HRR75_004697 [Exophiala dermatitidis]EHY57814.1 hypothetical protein HMPREF1120_05838 [Exophiala dermatitidis NIH/UT8656]KAJ4515968.1 hypothetical protein HRR74_005125 [Exophiala dermatitidis]KAJ4518626.1 hypothetical protein HRR73_004207 [Exophiala dermatitidis]KAJ4534137.1 hypothetical protein HRR76_006073 [Exophiala dermatitidis]